MRERKLWKKRSSLHREGRDLRIRLLGSLKVYSGKEEIELEVSGKTRLREVLSKLVKLEPSLSRAIEDDGKIKPGYLVFINDADYMVYQGLETEVGGGDIITIMPVSHGGSDVEGEVDLYRRGVEALERMCRVEYYKGYGGRELVASIEKILRERCGKDTYLLVLRDKLLVSPRIAVAALVKLKRAEKRSDLIARKPSIELLLRILGTRKISKAIESIGSAGVGEKNIVIISCERCNTKDLEDLLERIYPDEEGKKKGVRSIAELCLEGRSDRISGRKEFEDLEELEKLVISCGASLEVEE